MPRTPRQQKDTRHRPINSPRYGLRRHEYRRTADIVLRYKGEEQDIILVPFMYSKSEDRYLIKISERSTVREGDGNQALWRWIDIPEW